MIFIYHPHRDKPFGAAVETGEVFLQPFGIICQYLANHNLDMSVLMVSTGC